MPSKFEERIRALENIVAEHLRESGAIQANLKFNTWLTGGIALAIVTRAIAELFHK